MVACCGVGAVGADEEVEIYGDFCSSFGGGFLGGVLGMICSFGMLLFEPSRLLLEIGTGKLVIEMQGYVRHFLQCIQEAFVEGSTIDGLDTLSRSISCISCHGFFRDGPFHLHHRLEILHRSRHFSAVHGSCGRAWVWSLPIRLQEVPGIRPPA